MLTNAYTIRRASRAYTLCFQQRSLLKGLNTTAPVLGRAQRPDGGSRPMLPSQSSSAGWTEPRGLSAIPWHFAHWNASPRRLLRDLRKRGVSKNLLFIYLLIRFVSENFLNRKLESFWGENSFTSPWLTCSHMKRTREVRGTQSRQVLCSSPSSVWGNPSSYSEQKMLFPDLVAGTFSDKAFNNWTTKVSYSQELPIPWNT